MTLESISSKLVSAWERLNLAAKVFGSWMFAQPRLIHNSHVSFYTSRKFCCQEFIDLGLKHPGNLVYIQSALSSLFLSI